MEDNTTTEGHVESTAMFGLPSIPATSIEDKVSLGDVQGPGTKHKGGREQGRDARRALLESTVPDIFESRRDYTIPDYASKYTNLCTPELRKADDFAVFRSTSEENGDLSEIMAA
jgi:hypothetical protein